MKPDDETDVMPKTADNAQKTATKQFADCTALLDNPPALRERADQGGYLFFRNLLNPDKLLPVRHRMMLILQEAGLLDKRHHPDEGIADYEAVNNLPLETVAGLGVPWNVLEQLQKLESFHMLAHEPALLRVMSMLLGEKVFPHPRNIVRIVTPHKAVKATPPHQDFLHIQGDARTWTVWFPLGDCPRTLGGLSVLEGSHRQGLFGVTELYGAAGGLESILCGLDLEWVDGDYGAGDVLMFHSHTVHRALPCQEGNRIRLSCDFRFQSANVPIDRYSLLPHGRGNPFSWDTIYEGWTNEALKYYWHQYALTYTDYDESIRWQKEKLC